MSYFFKINDNDYSMYVNKLMVSKEHLYTPVTTSAGNTVVKYINNKRVLEVGIIPLDDTVMARLLTDVDKFKVSISFRDPQTNLISENVVCIIPKNTVDYYTIQAGKVMYKAFSLQIKEL